MLGNVLRSIDPTWTLPPSEEEDLLYAYNQQLLPAIVGADQVATLLDLPRKTILDLCRAKQIPGAKIGGRWVFHRDAFLDWLRQKNLQNLNQANAVSITDSKPKPTLKMEAHNWSKISRPDGSGENKISLVNSKSQDAGVAQKRRQKCQA